MACALTAGYTQDGCNDGLGGTKLMYVIELANVSFTETAGVITAITNGVGKKWQKFELPKNTANFKATINSNVANGSQYHTHEVSIVANKLKTATRQSLSAVDKNTNCWICKDENGTFWLAGRKNGLNTTAGGSDSGTASADRNGYTRTFTGDEPEDLIEVQASLIADLEIVGD